MKKNVILSVLFILVMIIFVSCDKDEDPVSAVKKFEIVSVVPANNATNVSIEAAIVITFSKPVVSVDALVGAHNDASGTVDKFSSDKKVYTIDPIGVMEENTVYGLAVLEAISIDGDTLRLFSEGGEMTPLTQIEFTTGN